MTHARMELNGEPLEVEDLRAVALASYGHFTSMQVRDGCVRGLDLHLDRLVQATLELFGHPLDTSATRGWMRRIAGTTGDLSLRVSVFSRAFNRDRPIEPVAPDVLVSAAPARAARPGPLRVCSVHYTRDLPLVKHLGTFGLFNQRRLAQARGFDDAVFIAADGAVSEGTVWNIGFFDGNRVIWPDAPALNGISMQLLKHGLAARGLASDVRALPLTGIGAFRAAFFTNTSCVAAPIAAIDDTVFAIDPYLLALLDACVALAPWQRI